MTDLTLKFVVMFWVCASGNFAMFFWFGDTLTYVLKDIHVHLVLILCGVCAGHHLLLINDIENETAMRLAYGFGLFDTHSPHAARSPSATWGEHSDQTDVVDPRASCWPVYSPAYGASHLMTCLQSTWAWRLQSAVLHFRVTSASFCSSCNCFNQLYLHVK